MEGYTDWRDADDDGKHDREFSAGDMYLTCRLDGPKEQGESAVFAVRALLERAKRASSLSYGINPAQAVVGFDDRLKEITFGDGEGLTIPEVEAKEPEAEPSSKTFLNKLRSNN